MVAFEWQNPPDADIILRASGGKQFHAHKLVLSLASPVFRDMFSVHQPPDSGPPKTPIVDVDNPPDPLEMFLQIIYPVRTPSISDAEALASLSQTSIHMYAIFCAYGREKEAEAAARRVSFASLAHLNSSPLLRLMTVEYYQRLLGFIVARDQRTREIVIRHREKIANDNDYVRYSDAHPMYSNIVVAAVQAGFEANPCVRVIEALGLVSSTHRFPLCSIKCKHSTGGLQRYAEALLKELVEMTESLPWVD